jgi:hypothetical protein
MAIHELRIHGVGGSPGERLLGLGHPDQAVVVGEGLRTVFLARRSDRCIEGYDWGALTSGSPWQPLWVLLLPFTLVNVAGWAHPPFDRISPRRLRLLRALVHASAALLTASWTLWVGIITIDHLGYQWLGAQVAWPARLAGVDPRVVGVAAGVLATAGAMAGLWAVARSSTASFEHLRPDTAILSESDLPEHWGPDEDLTSPAFFSHESSMNDRLAWHVGVIAASLLALLAKMAVTWGEDRLLLGEVFVLVGAAQFAAILALAVVCWTASRTANSSATPGSATPSSATPSSATPSSATPDGAPRWLPAAAVTVAVALTNGSFAGATLLAARLHPDGRVPWGPELALMDSFVVALLLWVVAAVVWLLRHRGAGEASELPARTSATGQEMDGVSDASRRRVAATRGLAAAGHDAARPLAWFAALFLASSAVLSVRRLTLEGPPWTWLRAPEDPGLLMGAAAWLLPLLALGAVLLVWRAARFPALRRGVGILWDVLTFWPRRYHPLAVRPYTERAVPEFQARIRHLVASDDGLLLSAHSQGTVIAFAALAALDDEQVQRVGLLTYGSPLRTLYGRIFPAYLGDATLTSMRARLAAGPAGWHNLWRRTDPIGGPVLGPDQPGVDIECSDPATEPGSTDLPESDPDPEPLRRAWVELRGHSYYYRERAYKTSVAQLRAALARLG